MATAINTVTKAVIYPANSVSGYGHIYSLGIAGVHVTALSPVDCGNFLSRYVSEKYVVPDPCADHEQFVSWLIDYGKQQKNKLILFMAEDMYAYIASLYQKQLSPYYCYPYIPNKRLEVLFNKRAMLQTAAAAGLCIPKSLFSPVTNDEIDSWSDYPAVVKPAVSRFTFKGTTLQSVCGFQKLFGGKAVFASDSQELRKHINLLQQVQLTYCIQEYIPGDNAHLYTAYFVADGKGSIPSFSTHYKVRQLPADFGTTSVSQSAEVPLLRTYAENFCKAAQYAGPATMEFKRSAHDGAWYLMEINPRLGFAIRRSTVKGVNIVLQQYLFSTGQELMNVRQRDDRCCWIDIPGDLKSLLWRRTKKQWRLSLWQIVKPYIFFREAVFNINDPLPGLVRLGLSVIRFVRHMVFRKKKHV